MEEGVDRAAGRKVASPNVDEVGSDNHIPGVICDQCAIDGEVVERVGVDIQKHCPVAVDNYICPSGRKHPTIPHRGIAPLPHEALLHEDPCGWGTVVETVDSIDLSVLELGPIAATDADQQLPLVAQLVVVEVLAVLAASHVELGGVIEFEDVVQRGEFLDSPPHGTDLEQFSVLGVVEPEDDAEVDWEEGGAGGDGEVGEVDAHSPPDVVDFASDVRQGPGVG